MNKELFRQIFLYGIIGGFSASIDFIIFTGLIFLAMNSFIANGISIHVGIFTSFFLNSRFNFKKKDKIVRRGSVFYLIGLTGLLISMFLLWLGEMMGVPVLIAKGGSVFVVAAVQFTINKFVTFRA